MRAVDGLELDVPSGSVAVLLGPNGAGKTTTVRLITGALKVDSDHIRVLGLDPKTNGTEIRQRAGVVPPKPALYDRLAGWENLAFTAGIWGVGHDATPEAAARFGIDYAINYNVEGYSTGMLSHLALARAVIHDPEVLLLDEPTAGLDPESSRAVLDLIRELAGRGCTIVMCTHPLHAAEGIADQVVLMGASSARAAGHPTRLTAEWNGALHVTLQSLDGLPDLVNELVANGTD